LSGSGRVGSEVIIAQRCDLPARNESDVLISSGEQVHTLCFAKPSEEIKVYGQKERIKEIEVETGMTQLGEKEREQEEGKKGR
jgi:hypothetical protein